MYVGMYLELIRFFMWRKEREGFMVGCVKMGKRDLNGKLIVGSGLALKGGKYLSKYLPFAYSLIGLNIC